MQLKSCICLPWMYWSVLLCFCWAPLRHAWSHLLAPFNPCWVWWGLCWAFSSWCLTVPAFSAFIFIVLYCICLSLYWEAQNWMQDWTERKKCFARPAGNSFPNSDPNAEYSLCCKASTWCPPQCSEPSLKICSMPGQPPAHPAVCASSIWSTGFGICLCWTPWICCQAISAVCWVPPEWKHTHLVVSQQLFPFCIVCRLAGLSCHAAH